MSRLITSSSHGPGHTSLTFSKDGSRAFTGGQDCIVRIWKIDEGAEQEPETAAEAEGAVSSVSATGDCWISGSEDAEVRRYATHRGEMVGMVTSANAVPIRCVAIDPKGKRVAVASDEFSVKIVELEDIMKVSVLRGHEGGVRRVTWHPFTSLVTTCGTDGKIMVWDVSRDEPRIESTIEGIIPTVSDSESSEFAYDCSAVWHTSGQHFFVASRAHEIVTISKSDWSKTSTLSDKDVAGAITALALSTNGVYLASACLSKVYIWSTQTRRIVASHAGTPGSTITQLAFSPRENLLAWTDTQGIFTRWPNPIPSTFPDPIKPSIATNAAASVQGKPKTGLNLFGDDLIAGIGDMSSGVPTGDVNLDADLDADTGPKLGDMDDDWIIDDIGDGAMDDVGGGGRDSGGYVKEMVSITKAQPPFQPGSTPMENRKRYLAHNTLGVIEVTDQDTHHIVNVEFFDRSARKGYHFTDRSKYNLGYLGERGAVFACPPESDHPAQVYYRPYTSWGQSYEWTYTLSRKGSTVLGVAAGGLPLQRSSEDSSLQGYGDVVVATSEGDLTFLSGTGRERRIVGLGADFVSMVAAPEWIFVVHRAGATTIDGSQNLTYTMFNFEDFSVRQKDVLPIPKGHVLKWIGLTDQGAPAIHDSAGYVHVLTKFRIPHHASWARVMDTNLLERRQGKDESYWPVGITESTLMCLILKGRQEHPGFPRPLIQELPMRMPFRKEEPREEQVERELLHIHTALDLLDEDLTTDSIVTRERAIDKEFIILIQGACKADNIPRALELSKLLHQLTSFDAAMKIADFYHLPGFREKVGILKGEREENEDRLLVMRDKRRRWMKPDPQLRQVQVQSYGGRVDPLGDVRPPLAIERPGMARVTVPVIETTRYSSMAPLVPPEPTQTETQLMDSQSTTSGEGKRKRAEGDGDVSGPSSSLPMAPPPKQKTNPFARKAGTENTRNPFARKSESNKTIQKSESFFDKIDMVDENNGSKSKRPFLKPNGKEKEKTSTGSRQATLFGMLPPQPKDKNKQNNPFGRKKGGSESTPAASQVDATQNPDPRAIDVMMSDAPLHVATLVETSHSQAPDESGWEETQMAEDVDGTQ